MLRRRHICSFYAACRGGVHSRYSCASAQSAADDRAGIAESLAWPQSYGRALDRIVAFAAPSADLKGLSRADDLEQINQLVQLV
jgi:hypothetical protein